jgi:hypothetical protein
MLAEGNQEPVDLHPIAAREPPLELCHRVFRLRGAHVPPPVRYAMDMNVDRNSRLSAGAPERQVRAFRPDTPEAA